MSINCVNMDSHSEVIPEDNPTITLPLNHVFDSNKLYNTFTYMQPPGYYNNEGHFRLGVYNAGVSPIGTSGTFELDREYSVPYYMAIEYKNAKPTDTKRFVYNTLRCRKGTYTNVYQLPDGTQITNTWLLRFDTPVCLPTTPKRLFNKDDRMPVPLGYYFYRNCNITFTKTF